MFAFMIMVLNKVNAFLWRYWIILKCRNNMYFPVIDIMKISTVVPWSDRIPSVAL